MSRLSLSHGSGYLEIDHSDSPGLSPADVACLPGAVAVGKGQHFEADIQMCSHCQRGVLLRPDRVRDRGYCPKCDHYVCDTCEGVRVQTGECKTFKEIIETVGELVDTVPKGTQLIITDADLV